jgi:hypothetical protein
LYSCSVLLLLLLLLYFDSNGVTDIVQLFYYQFQKFSIEQKMFSVESAPLEA